jgi:hypothetical protein
MLNSKPMIAQWLIQAHLSTESYADAMAGLRRVRRFRRFSHWIRYPSALLVLLINNALSACRFRRSSESQVLVWSKEGNYQLSVGQMVMSMATNVQHLPFREFGAEEVHSETSKSSSADQDARGTPKLEASWERGQDAV